MKQTEDQNKYSGRKWCTISLEQVVICVVICVCLPGFGGLNIGVSCCFKYPKVFCGPVQLLLQKLMGILQILHHICHSLADTSVSLELLIRSQILTCIGINLNFSHSQDAIQDPLQSQWKRIDSPGSYLLRIKRLSWKVAILNLQNYFR